MRRVTRALPAGSWSEARRTATVTLPWADRYRRRLRMTDDAGDTFLLDLDRAVPLADGDGLVLVDGGVIAVQAAAEAVIEVRSADAAEAARLAWHLGNRHTAVQVLPDGGLRLLDDPVLADMLSRLGAAMTSGRAQFAPEAGAYAVPAHDHGPAEAPA